MNWVQKPYEPMATANHVDMAQLESWCALLLDLDRLIPMGPGYTWVIQRWTSPADWMVRAINKGPFRPQSKASVIHCNGLYWHSLDGTSGPGAVTMREAVEVRNEMRTTA